MPRVIVELPATFSFSTELPLYSIHINRGGHFDNAMVLSVVAEARNRYITSLGYSDEDTEGLALFAGDAAVQYISEGFYGDVMMVEMRAWEFNKYGFDLVFRMSKKADGREVARGKLGLVFYDREAKKVALAPNAFKEKISR
jgi:acyl-CoA thioester hydrolase